MKNLYFFAALLLFSMVSFAGYSQTTFTLSGKIVDLSGQIIPSGTVKLLTFKDSTLVKSAQVNGGDFNLREINQGDYLLKTSSMGFNEDVKTISLRQDTSLVMIMADQSTILNEVQISGSKQVFSNNKGNIKVNIENTILAQTQGVVDLISRLPAVQLSADKEKISIIGRGEPLIYLDNQRVTINDLNSLSTQDIKTIEIVNNPSSKYEAEGRSVILITGSRNKMNGTKVALSAANSFKRYFHTRNGLNVSVKKNKFEFKGNLQYNYSNLWESNSNNFMITDEGIATNYRVYSIGTRIQSVLNGGFYYQMNDTDYLSANVSKRYQDGDFLNTTDTHIREVRSENDVSTHNKNEGDRPFFNTNLNFNKKLKRINGQLFIGAQYAKFAHDLTSDIFNDYNQTGMVPSQGRQQDYGVDVISGRADFEKSFKNEVKMEIGTSLSSAKSNSAMNQTDYNSLQQSVSRFDYAEQNYAAYTQASGKIGKASFSVGLRMENTDVKGDGGSASLVITKNDTDFFPKASVDIPFSASNSLSFNYTKSITRPNYAAMSQITTYINPFFEWANNVNINPTIKQEISATLNVKDNSIGLTYYQGKDPVYYAVDYNEDIRRLRMINTNYESESGWNLNFTVPFKYRKWASTNTLTGVSNKVKDPAAVLNKTKPYLYLYSNNQFELPGGYTLMISGWGTTKRNDGVFEQNAMYAIDTAVTKTFFKKLSATISYNSVLGSQESKENFAINNVIAKGVYYADVREIGLSLKYAFGNIKDSKYRNKDVDDNMNRIR